MNYGQRVETGTTSDNVLILNLRDSTLNIETQSSDVLGFLNGQTQFHIHANLKMGRRVWAFVSESGFFFYFDPQRRIVQVTAGNMSPRQHFIWFEEVKF